MKGCISQKYFEEIKEIKASQNKEARKSMFEPDAKKVTITGMVLVLLGSAAIICASILCMFNVLNIYISGLISLGGFLLLCISLLILFKTEKRKHCDKLNDLISYRKQRLEKLDQILRKDFSLYTSSCAREKITELIDLYQSYVDKREEELRRRSKLVTLFFSAFGGMITISLYNLDKIGIEFITWLYLVFWIALAVLVASTLTYLYAKIDPVKAEYKTMINDLKDLLLIKY